MNPLNWIFSFWDKQASWGLLTTEWAKEPNLETFIGAGVGLICLISVFAFMAVTAMDFIDDHESKFDDNALTSAGYWLFSFVLGLVAVVSLAVLAGVAACCVVSLLAGLLLAKPLFTLFCLLAVGPILIVIGKLRSHGLSLSRVTSVFRRFKPRKRNHPRQVALSTEEGILAEEFHVEMYEGVPIVRPN